MNRHNHLDTLAMGLLTLLCLSWGLQQISVKVALADVPPILQGGIRGAVATLLVWGWLTLRGTPLFNKDGTLWVGLLVGLLFAAEFVFLYWGLAFTTASRAIVFLYLSPFVVAIGAHLFVPGETLRAIQVVGLLCAFSGIVTAFGEAAFSSKIDTLRGDVMLMVAAILWGATTVTIKATRLAVTPSGKTLFYQLAVSAVLMPAASLVLEDMPTSWPESIALGALAYQAVWVAFITYLAWFWLIRNYPAGRLAAFTFLAPLFGVAMGAALLDEPITDGLLAALVLVGGGIYLVNKPKPAADPVSGLSRE